MRERVEKLIDTASQGIWLGTFHSVCGRILRREAELLPVDQNFVIFDEDDQHTLMKEIVRESGRDEKLFRPASILDAISRAKNELISPENYPIQNYRDEQVRQFYIRYQQMLVRNNAMDFDDMLVYTQQLFANYPQVRETWAHKFEHILVDEFQDTNYAQYAILRSLAQSHHNIYAVGDEDQSIYRWRGADYHNIQRFQADFKDAQTLLLEQNYRSTQTILDGAMAVIDRNPNRTHKKLFTEKQSGEKITLFVAADDREEAAYVVEAVRQGLRSNKHKPSDFAVMYRTNAQSRLLEEAFRREGINYRLVGAQRFYGRREVKDMIAYLRLVSNPKDEISLRRVINLPPRGIGEKTLEKLAELARTSEVTLGEAVLRLSEPNSAEILGSLGREGARLELFGRKLAQWRHVAENNPPVILFDRIIEDTGYQTYIQDNSEEGQDRWENVLELRQVVMEYAQLPDFLEAMALVADGHLPENVDTPTLLTLHAAKGLSSARLHHRLDEMLLPHSRSRDDPETLEEERRLPHVGITRAKKSLTLTRARRRRSPYGSYEETQPRAFGRLSEDPCSPRGLPNRLNTSYQTDYSRWEMPVHRQSVKADVPQETRYKPGMQVRHKTYGRGVVKTSRLELGDETVEVYFESYGLKALVASLANLEIL